LGKKRNGDEKEISPEERAQEKLEKSAAREGYDVRDNFVFLREYGADNSYIGMIFAKAVIESRNHRVSVFPEDIHEKTLAKRLSRFQRSVREYLSTVKVKLRFAEAKDITVEEVLGEFDEIDFVEGLRKTSILKEGRMRGIENVLYDILKTGIPFKKIADAVTEGAERYRRKKEPGQYFYLEARYIQTALEDCLTKSKGDDHG
jgi:hypothetical protein